MAKKPSAPPIAPTSPSPSDGEGAAEIAPKDDQEITPEKDPEVTPDGQGRKILSFAKARAAAAKRRAASKSDASKAQESE